MRVLGIDTSTMISTVTVVEDEAKDQDHLQDLELEWQLQRLLPKLEIKN